MPSVDPLSSTIRLYRGKPTLFINDKPQPPLLYALTDVPGGRWSWEEVPQHNLRLMAELGFRLFQVDLFLEHLWFEDGRFDLHSAQRQIRGVLDACPEAAVFIRLHVNAPRWWSKAHPEEWTQYADVPVTIEDEAGFHRIIEYDNSPVNRVSLASQRWRQEASEKVVRFCEELAATDEGNALAGLHMACGVYGEWHYWGFFRNEPDTGPAMTRHFRAWLKGRYGTDQALRAAWRDRRVSLESAQVPGYQVRAQTRAGLFRSPAEERWVIDYYRCQQELVADTIVHFCRLAKERWPRPLVTGTFYGYLFPMFGRQAAGGHLELGQLLTSPWVDYLSGPQCYFPCSTEPGGAYRSRSLLESCRLHGKLWLDEMDQKPDLMWGPLAPGYRGSGETSVARLRRNLAATLTRGHGLWLYDFGVGFANAGWWDHPLLAEELRRLLALFVSRLEEDFDSDADVLVVYDTEAFYYLATTPQADPVSQALMDETTLAIYLSGAVCDQIHRADLRRVDLGKYRVVVFANLFMLDKGQREFINERVAKDGRQLVFFYAPGYCDGSTLSVAHMSEVTGIALRETDAKPELIVVHPGWPAERLRLGGESLRPLFVADDRGAQTVGVMADSLEPAFARKQGAESVRWYCALPITSASLMRRLLAEAGAHIYGGGGDVFYAGHGLLCVHSKEGGRRAVCLKDGTALTVDLPSGGTAILDARTGALLMA
ncbi:MAG: hypothetical protein QHJ34_12580 [bacterium]|jgi:hypothetical protein|nr:hypothetical protein [candidate division KSB1 bacterium]MDH7561047.1 hypothetical protein [bacterium]